MKHIETPEGFSKDATAKASLRDQISIRISFLTSELETLNTKLEQEKCFFRRLQLEDQKLQLEHELRWARFQKQHLKNSVFGMETREA